MVDSILSTSQQYDTAESGTDTDDEEPVKHQSPRTPVLPLPSHVCILDNCWFIIDFLHIKQEMFKSVSLGKFSQFLQQAFMLEWFRLQT
jgi:hypothetical protein